MEKDGSISSRSWGGSVMSEDIGPGFVVRLSEQDYLL